MLIQENELKKISIYLMEKKLSSREQCQSFYSKQVKFIDPTQEKKGLDAFIKVQDD